MKNNLRRLSVSTTLIALLILGMVSHIDNADAEGSAATKQPKKGRIALLYAQRPVEMGIITSVVIAAIAGAGTGVYFLGKEVKERYIDKKIPEQTSGQIAASPVNNSNNRPTTSTSNQPGENNDPQAAASTDGPSKNQMEVTIEDEELTTESTEEPQRDKMEATIGEVEPKAAELATPSEIPEKPDSSESTEDAAQPQGFLSRARNVLREFNPLKFSKLNKELSEQERRIAEKAKKNGEVKAEQAKALKDLGKKDDDILLQDRRLIAKNDILKRKTDALKAENDSISEFAQYRKDQKTRDERIDVLKQKQTGQARDLTAEEAEELLNLEMHRNFEQISYNFEQKLRAR